MRVAASATEVALELQRQLRGRPDDDDPAAGLGISLDAAHAGSSFHWVRWGGCPVVRARDPSRALAALEFAMGEAIHPASHEVRLACRSLVVPGRGAVLLPPEAEDHVLRLDRYLRERGLLVVDSRSTIIDTAAGEVVVRTGRALERDRLSSLMAGEQHRRAEPFIDAGSHPLAGVLTTSASAAVGRVLVAALGARNSLSQDTVKSLADLLREIPWRRVPDWRPSVVLDAVRALTSW